MPGKFLELCYWLLTRLVFPPSCLHCFDIKLIEKGKLLYQKAFGPKSPTESIDFDTTFIFASCTKLMTSISALQCVERGQIGLDDDVSKFISELRDLQILTGYDEGGKPILKKAENKITLR